MKKSGKVSSSVNIAHHEDGSDSDQSFVSGYFGDTRSIERGSEYGNMRIPAHHVEAQISQGRQHEHGSSDIPGEAT